LPIKGSAKVSSIDIIIEQTAVARKSEGGKIKEEAETKGRRREDQRQPGNPSSKPEQ